MWHFELEPKIVFFTILIVQQYTSQNYSKLNHSTSDQASLWLILKLAKGRFLSQNAFTRRPRRGRFYLILKTFFLQLNILICTWQLSASLKYFELLRCQNEYFVFGWKTSIFGAPPLLPTASLNHLNHQLKKIQIRSSVTNPLKKIFLHEIV